MFRGWVYRLARAGRVAIPAGSGEALLRYVLFFWIVYKIYRFMQCAPVFILCFQWGSTAMGRARAPDLAHLSFELRARVDIIGHARIKM